VWAQFFFLAVLTVLLYDHLLTLPEEVATVWKKKKTYVLYLFLFIRYYAPVAVSVVAFGMLHTDTLHYRCKSWMLFLPLGMTVPLMLFPGILMLVRVYALYNRNKIILGTLSIYLLVQTVTGIWQYTIPGGIPAPLPLDNYEFHFCIYLPPKRIGRVSTVYLFMELTYDSLIFLLTIARTIYMHWMHQRSGPSTRTLMDKLIRDGAAYFAAIFSMTLTWVLMIMYAPTGLRGIASIPSACVTTVMISRITLNIRTTVYGPPMLDERTAARHGPNAIPLAPLESERSKRFNNTAPKFPSISVPAGPETGDRSYRGSSGEMDMGNMGQYHVPRVEWEDVVGEEIS
ncbi:hypothetical protein HETIRDRAFT_326903, partial [Heterobasidion irregulare TC 32-1]